MNRKGILIVIEGVDNIGKTATRDLLTSRFEAEGVPVQSLEFPYKGFNTLRKISKEKKSTHYERLLAHALSHSMTYPIIDDALCDGNVVILDRYWYSNLAYAPTFAGIPYGYIKDLEGVKLQPITPDMVIYLHADGVYPKFHRNAEIKNDKNDAFDKADRKQRQQLIRAYDQVIEKEWINNDSINFHLHNVDQYNGLEDSVIKLEGIIDEQFTEKLEQLKA